MSKITAIIGAGLAAAAALVGLSSGSRPSVRASAGAEAPNLTASQGGTRQATATNAPTARGSAVAVRRFDGNDPTAFFPIRSGGRTPYEFGISRECSRLVRAGRLRRAGVGGQKI